MGDDDDVNGSNETLEANDNKDGKRNNESKGKVRNTMLLSFGDEMEEEDEFSINLKGKGKSAHDLLDDDKLSKEKAIDTSKFGGQSEVPSTTTGFRKKKSKKEKVVEKIEEDVDLHKLVDESKTQENEEKLRSLKEEIRMMQKEYKKSLKQPSNEEEEEKSETVKEYYNTRLRFKDKTKNIHRLKDPRREEQTMEMLGKFRNKLHDLSIKKVMSEKRCADEVKEEKKEEPQKMEGEEEMASERIQMPNLDWEAEDLPDEEWMVHKFVAPAPDPNVTRAKDANLKDESEDWYDLSDPRNKINVRKRMKLDDDKKDL